MTDLYTIRLEDQVTNNANRVAGALIDVSVAAQYFARSVKQGDKEMMALDANMLKHARTQLMAARAAASAGNAVAKLGPKLPTNAIKQSTAAMGDATKQGFKFSYMANALANQLVNLGFAIVRNLGSRLVDAGKALYGVADLASRAHLSFGNFFGGQEKGDKVLQESIDIAKRYGMSIKDTFDQMNRFGAAGFTAEQSKGTLRFGADMLAAGRSVQDVKGIFLAMTQIMGKGKLQAEELTQQLAERGINAGRVWQILGDILHKTIPQVMALQKAGKIGSGVALNAIVQAGVEGVHGSKIGKAGEKVADATVGGLGRRMSTLIESAIFDSVDKASPALTKGMQSLFSGMNASSMTGLQANLTKALEGVGAFMEQIGPQIPAMVDGFSKAFGSAAGFDARNFKSFAEALPEVARNLGVIAGFIAKITGNLASTLGDTRGKDIYRVGGAGDQRFMNWITGGGFKTDAEKGIVSEKAQMAQDADAKSRRSGDDQIGDTVGRSIAEGMAGGILNGAPSVGKAAESLAGGAINSSKDALGIHSPSKVFRGQGENIAAGLAMGMDQSSDLAMHSASMMADGAIAGAAGSAGANGRAAIAAGNSAGNAMSSRSALTVRVGDVVLGGGGSGAGGSGGAAEEVRSYFENEFVSMLERHLEGVGA